MKNKIEVNKPFKANQTDITILERTDIFGFALCETPRAYNRPYYNTGSFYADQYGNEQFRPTFMLDIADYNQYRDKVYAKYLEAIEAHKAKIAREAAEAKATKEKLAINAGINKIGHEAQERQKELAASIREAVLQSDSLKSLMNNKEVKGAVTELTLLNSLFTMGIFSNVA